MTAGAGRRPATPGGETSAKGSRDKLRVSEIFHSIQGESSRAGLPTVFVRLTGCPLRCVWCDTAYAFAGGKDMSIHSILERVAFWSCKTVCVTGGEPLAQKASVRLLAALCDAGYSVSLETSGALDVSQVDPRVSRIVDLKAPGSGESERNLWSNLAHLGGDDEIKIVLASRADYDWALAACREHGLLDETRSGPALLFSPVHGQLDAATLAQWILDDRAPVRFQWQLHKLLWGSTPGR